MQCSHLILVRDKKGYVQRVPCGQCIACRLNYGKLWSIRMMEELKKHDKACFVTLTYSDDTRPADNILRKRDLQLFFKRLRKERHVRYFACGEYGDRFGHCHYHAIIYGVAPDEHDLIEKHWQQGFVKLGTVTEDSCAYVAKYMTKKLRGKSLEEKLQEDPDYQNEFVLMSRRPGIGSDLSDSMVQFLKDNKVYYRKGIMSGLPRYWKDKHNIHRSLLPSYLSMTPEEKEKQNFILNNSENYDRLIDKRLKFFKRKD